MKKINKTAPDLIDNIYSVAYWMTGSEEISSDLVYCTYLSANLETDESTLLKRFRECYVARFGQYADFSANGKPFKSYVQIVDSLMQWAADIKLTVLLSEISGLKHRQISEIVDKPVETVRIWLLWGRKLLSVANPVHVGQLKAS
jgi:hypothetical protein